MSNGQRFQAFWIIARDVIVSAVAIWGIIHEELSGHAQWPLLLTYLAMLGIVTGANLAAIRKAESSSSRDTGSQPSSSPRRSSSPSPPHSSSKPRTRR